MEVPAGPDGTTRVLIVDDERMNRTLLEAVLARSGYATVSAKDGQEAWDILDADPTGFETILLDRRMPRMNGMELLTRIRADERLQYLPVIMQTAHSSTEDVVEGIKAGAFYYLAKPLNQLTLAELQGIDPTFGRDALGVFNLKTAMAKRNITGAPGTREVAKQLVRWRELLS